MACKLPFPLSLLPSPSCHSSLVHSGSATSPPSSDPLSPNPMSGIQFVHYDGTPESAITRLDRHSAKPVVNPDIDARPPRPMNAWILFRAQKLRDFKATDPDFRAPQGVISKAVSELWKGATVETKRIYGDLAEVCRAEHAAKYPKYKFKVRAKGLRLKIKASKLQPRTSPLQNTGLDMPLPLSPSYSYPNPFSSNSSASSSAFSSPTSSIFDMSFASTSNATVWAHHASAYAADTYGSDESASTSPVLFNYELSSSYSYADAQPSRWNPNSIEDPSAGCALEEQYTNTLPADEGGFVYFPQASEQYYEGQEEDDRFLHQRWHSAP